MKIIGINYLSESSVCLLIDGKLVSAISEERINRKKNWYGIPYVTINLILKKFKLKYSDIDYYVTSGSSVIDKSVPDLKAYKEKIIKIDNSNIKKDIKLRQIRFLKKRLKHEDQVINLRTKKILSSLKKKFKNLIIYDHHRLHAASACYSSGFKKSICLTIDGWGDNSSSKIFTFENGNIAEIASTPTIDSLGYFYGSITKLLGFKPHQHEGKVLGLAAYGNKKKLIKEIVNMISYDKKNKKFIGNYEGGIYQSTFDNNNLNFIKKKYSKEQIAYSAQYALERAVLDCVGSLSKTKINLTLAGGVFANVKLNQKIKQLKIIRDMHVFPNMGDGGLAVGGAQLCYFLKTKKKPKKINSMYLGNEYSEKEILNEIKKYKLNYSKPKEIEKKIALILSEGKVVAHFNGKMEFGPRALGNRSILSSASDPNINKTLNDKLSRTEFMPFAPIILDKHAKNYFYINKLSDYKFMTYTCDCKKLMLKEAPASVHIDKTARPQIVLKNENLRLSKILIEYKKITKISALINTSFNMHEEPIVCSPSDAIRGFLRGNLDHLVLGNYLVLR
jgi:carbamoyltransferase